MHYQFGRLTRCGTEPDSARGKMRIWRSKLGDTTLEPIPQNRFQVMGLYNGLN